MTVLSMIITTMMMLTMMLTMMMTTLMMLTIMVLTMTLLTMVMSQKQITKDSFSRGGLRRGNAETISLNCRLRAAASRRKKDWEEEVVTKAGEMGGEAFVVAKIDEKEHSHLSLYSSRPVVGATGNKAVKFLKLPSRALPITQVFNNTPRLFNKRFPHFKITFFFFLAAVSSSRTTVVGPSVCPSVMFVKK